MNNGVAGDLSTYKVRFNESSKQPEFSSDKNLSLSMSGVSPWLVVN